MSQIRDQNPVDLAIRLLQAVGDSPRQADVVMSYIDGMKAGIRLASAGMEETRISEPSENH